MMNPILAYRFRIRLLDSKPNTIIRAQQVSGLQLTLKQSKFKTSEGIKKLPSEVKYGTLTIDRAILEEEDNEAIDMHELINELTVTRINMGIHLLDAGNNYVRSWNVIGAYPVSWSISALDATSNKVIMQQITFDYQYIRQIKQQSSQKSSKKK